MDNMFQGGYEFKNRIGIRPLFIVKKDFKYINDFVKIIGYLSAENMVK